MSKKRIIAITILLLIALVAFIFAFLIPAVNAWEAECEMQKDVEKFEAVMSGLNTPTTPLDDSQTTQPTEDAASDGQELGSRLPEEMMALRDWMAAYNQEIYLNAQENLQTRADTEAQIIDVEQYGLPGSIFGVVSIPAIEVEMPLYLGASRSNLAKGFAHMSQTSMPIGGISTNAVLAAHRGWNGADYLRYVDKVELGDMVYVQIPWETLEYKVVEIKIISPWEKEEILIQPDRDLLSILTCHPYGVSSHRYMLICERVIETPS